MCSGVALQLLFYLTPIFYEASKRAGALQGLYRLNPMAHMVEAYRAVLLRGELPDAGKSAVSDLVVCRGAPARRRLVWFQRASHRFADEL